MRKKYLKKEQFLAKFEIFRVFSGLSVLCWMIHLIVQISDQFNKIISLGLVENGGDHLKEEQNSNWYSLKTK